MINMHIGSADATGLDGDLYLPRPGGLGFPLLDAKITGSMDDDGFHCCTPAEQT